MSLSVATVLTDTRRLLNDTAGDRWTLAMLLGWITECYIELASKLPETCAVRYSTSYAAGAVQSAPAGTLRIHRILGIDNGSGVISRVLTQASADTLFAEDPAWMAATTGTPDHWARVAGDDSKYYLYPAPTGTGSVLMERVETPPTLSAGNESISSLDVVHQPIVVDYVLYRAFAVDADNNANAELSASYYAAYQAKLNELLTAERSAA